MSLSTAAGYAVLVLVQAALVALPSPTALSGLSRLRSPAWALALPGALLVGTFGVLGIPRLADHLLLLAMVVTPVLAAVAVVAVVHGHRRALLLVPVALAILTAVGGGLAGQLGASLLTALGCLTLGAALARLTTPRWLLAGVVAMAAVDVALLLHGVGGEAADRLATAGAAVSGPTFDQAQVGAVSADYPDLFLAAMVGGVLAGTARQRRAAVLVTTLAAAYGLLFLVVDIMPATVPLLLAFLLAGARPESWRRLLEPLRRAAAGLAPPPRYG